MLFPVLDAIGVHAGGPGRPRKHPDLLLADQGYAHDSTRARLRRRGIAHVSLVIAATMIWLNDPQEKP